jgi:hypothetical protein
LRLRRARLEYFDGFAPGGLLAGVNLPQVEHVPLHHLAPPSHTPVLDQAPIMMFFAVFETCALFEKHAAGD